MELNFAKESKASRICAYRYFIRQVETNELYPRVYAETIKKLRVKLILMRIV